MHGLMLLQGDAKTPRRLGVDRHRTSRIRFCPIGDGFRVLNHGESEIPHQHGPKLLIEKKLLPGAPLSSFPVLNHPVQFPKGRVHLFRATFHIDLVLLSAPTRRLGASLRSAVGWNPKRCDDCEQTACHELRHCHSSPYTIRTQCSITSRVSRFTIRPLPSFLLLVTVTLVAYAGALQGDFQFDDVSTILQNSHLDR